MRKVLSVEQIQKKVFDASQEWLFEYFGTDSKIATYVKGLLQPKIDSIILKEIGIEKNWDTWRLSTHGNFNKMWSPIIKEIEKQLNVHAEQWVKLAMDKIMNNSSIRQKFINAFIAEVNSSLVQHYTRSMQQYMAEEINKIVLNIAESIVEIDPSMKPE